MLHIADRLGRASCGSREGRILPHNAWRWKHTSETCKQCAAIYRGRKTNFVLRKLGLEIL